MRHLTLFDRFLHWGYNHSYIVILIGFIPFIIIGCHTLQRQDAVDNRMDASAAQMEKLKDYCEKLEAQNAILLESLLTLSDRVTNAHSEDARFNPNHNKERSNRANKEREE